MLAVVNELSYRSLTADFGGFAAHDLYAQGVLKLAEKIRELRRHPDITFSDFGTRRRFSREWHDYVVEVLSEELPAVLLGTSNT